MSKTGVWMIYFLNVYKHPEGLGQCLERKFFFLLPTASQCKRFKQLLLCKIVVRCPHHLQLESPPHIRFPCVSKRTKKITTVNLPECKFSFFAPHRILVQKVQTSLITQNSVQVSPPPPKRIMTLYSFIQR